MHRYFCFGNQAEEALVPLRREIYPFDMLTIKKMGHDSHGLAWSSCCHPILCLHALSPGDIGQRLEQAHGHWILRQNRKGSRPWMALLVKINLNPRKQSSRLMAAVSGFGGEGRMHTAQPACEPKDFFSWPTKSTIRAQSRESAIILVLLSPTTVHVRSVPLRQHHIFRTAFKKLLTTQGHALEIPIQQV